MKKILLLGNLDSVHLQKVAAGIDRKEFAVYVIGGSRRSYTEINQDFLYVCGIYHIPFDRKLSYLAIAFKFFFIQRKINPDIVNAHYATSYGLISLLSKRRSKLVISVWGSDVLLFPDKSVVNFHLVKHVLNSADFIFATSRVLKQRCELLSNTEICLTPFGVDTNCFVKSREVKKGFLTFGTVKALEHVYGIDRLLRFFADFTKLYSKPVRLLIVGHGSQETHLRGLSELLGIKSKVEFVGGIPHAEVPRVLSAFDVFFALSRSESFGVAVLEASACGIPVITTRVGGLPEVVQEGITGLVVDEKDLEHLPEIVLDLIENNPNFKQMGHEGRTFVEKDFSLTSTSRIFNKCLTKACEQRY